MSAGDLLYRPSKWGEKYHACRADEIFGAGAAGPGKALCLNTLVPTPTGMKPLGLVHPGDLVFSQTGKAVKVLAESEVFTDRRCFELKIRNETIVSDANHEWVMSKGTKPGCNVDNAVMTSQEIFDSGAKKCFVHCEPVEYSHKELPIHPYLLGVMLFQALEDDRAVFAGYSHNTLIKLSEFKIKYEEAGYMMYRVLDPKVCLLLNQFIDETDRRIPEEYLTSSIVQRRQLTQGILDSQETGNAPVTHVLDPLTEDLTRLAGSLGFNCRAEPVGRGKKSRQQYSRVRFSGAHGRKWDDNSYINLKMLRVQLRSINECGSVPTKCIQVEGGTFLVGNSHVVTHNSMILLHDPLTQVQIEDLRCKQDDRLIPDSFDPWLKKAIMENPLTPGHSVGRALMMMREMPNHEENIGRAHRVFPTVDPEVKWNEKRGVFTFASGYKYQFGGCKDRGDHDKFRGQEYSWLGFDELTNFLKDQYDTIRTRLRTADPVLRHFMRCCAMSNPHLSSKGSNISLDDPMWVKRHFVDPWPEGNKLLVQSVTRRDGEKERVTRIYLPATLYDNPDKDFVRQYELTLLGKPKHIRDCYLYGKWDGIVGSHFGDYWNPAVHVCEPFKIPENWPIFRAMDWGFSTNGNVGYYALSPDNKLYKWFEITFMKKTAEYVAQELIKPFEEKNKLWNPNKGSKLNLIGGGPSDRQIWEERGSSAKTKYMEFADSGVEWVKADQRSREDNCQTFLERLLDHKGLTEAPGIVFFRNCQKSIQTVPSLETDPYNLEQTKKAANDHWYDETTYACRFAMQQDLSPTNHRDEPDEWGDSNERYY